MGHRNVAAYLKHITILHSNINKPLGVYEHLPLQFSHNTIFLLAIRKVFCCEGTIYICLRQILEVALSKPDSIQSCNHNTRQSFDSSVTNSKP